MKNIWIAVVVVVVVLAGGFFLLGGRQEETSQTPTTPESTTEDAMTEDDNDTAGVTVTLGEQNESGQTGTAVLSEENGQVTVALSTTGFEEGVAQPAHIHTGACPDVGGVTYPLTNVVDGESVTTLDVTLEQLASELPLAINVHKSTTEASVYTACGDLEL